MNARVDDSRNLFSNLILIFPLLLIYQLGVLFTYPLLNGVDFVSAFLFGSLGFTRSQYLIFVGSVIVAFVASLVLLKRHQRFHPRVVIPILLESSIYALSMGSLIFLVMTKVLGISPSSLAAGLEQQGLIGRFVMSLGAGVYEEIVFRLGLLGGLAAFFNKLLRWQRFLAMGAALLLSSIAFSAVHHLPPLGDPLDLQVFVFRVLAGIFFGLLFWFRGLAVAVYTHAFYDLYVLLLR
ncbi:MAG TPA: CPBP family intramembrane glutamic endopeptidase [Polyangia bacterium]